MKVSVYVEGPSDRDALRKLLAPLLDRKRQAGVAIDFFPSPQGDKKKTLLTKVPLKAANAIMNDPTCLVALVPDLYPRNKGFTHETFAEMHAGILAGFRAALVAKGGADDPRLEARFHVFCFKHDMEALLLACPGALARRLGAERLAPCWAVPVEDQDHDRPPKRVVEDLFHHHGDRYHDTVDTPLILGGQDYVAVADSCPQCFKPFVDFLESL